MKQYQMLIGGAWADPVSGCWFESVNPFTAAPWALVPRGTKADVERAVASAKAAFSCGPWRNTTATARGALLRPLGDLIAAAAARLAEMETREHGHLAARTA